VEVPGKIETVYLNPQKKKIPKRNRSKVKLIKHVKCQEKKFHSLLYFLC